jgi:hypothetical protein
MTTSKPRIISPMLPMTEEKSDLLFKACMEWNRFLYRGKNIKTRYWANPRANWDAYKMTALVRRQYVMKSMKKGRHIHHKLALHAMWTGLFSETVYTPRKAFFVPGYMMTGDGEHIWMRLYPRLELGFDFKDPAPYQMRVSRKEDQWWMDYLID